MSSRVGVGASSARRPLGVSPTARGWSFFAGGAAIWVGWVVVGLANIRLVTVVLLSALIVATLWVLWVATWGRVRAELHADIDSPSVGERFFVRAHLWHSLPFALVGTVRWYVDGQVLFGRGLRVLRGRGTWSDIEVLASERGWSELCLLSFEVGDPLGLVRLRYPLRARAQVLVVPRLADLDDAAQAVLVEGSGPVRSGGVEPGGNLRDYRRGDPMRQVHWKQSARQDRLLVNVPESGVTQHFPLAIDVDPSRYDDDPANFEWAISVAAALVDAWMSQGDTMSLSAVSVGNAPDEDGAPPSSISSLTQALRWLAELPELRASEWGRSAPGAPATRGAFVEATQVGAVEDGVRILITGRVDEAVRRSLAHKPPGTLVLTGPQDQSPGDDPALGGWSVLVVPPRVGGVASEANAVGLALTTGGSRGR